MDCKKLKEVIMPYLYGELEKNESNLVEEHLSACRNCRREINELKGTRALLDRKETPLPSEETLKAIVSFAEEAAPHRKKSFITLPHPLALGAVAAVILLFLALFPLLTHPPIYKGGVPIKENGIASGLDEIETEIALLREEYSTAVYSTFKKETDFIEEELGKLSGQIEGNDFL